MTYEDARNLKAFKSHCTCGGYAASMNGRDKQNPHMDWCPQHLEFQQWQAALESGEAKLKELGL
jgi:hypothetical protein